MNNQDLKLRTKRLALRVIRLVQALPHDDVSRTIGKRVLRSGTSVAANYRAAKRAKSTAHFISKMGDVEEECDETQFWLELAVEAELVRAELVQDLINEAGELLAITVASIKTAKQRKD
jgi:four helix bundle protein